MDINKVKSIGKEWIKEDMHRIYINNLETIYGLQTTSYKTGNISSATLNGEKISNSRARQLSCDLSCAKIYYDVKTGKFETQHINDPLKSAIIEKIMALVI